MARRPKQSEETSILRRMVTAAAGGTLTLSDDMRERIRAAAAALDAGASNDEPQAMLIDVLTNLMHFARFSAAHPTTEWAGTAQAVHFNEALRIARDHFDDEQAEEGGAHLCDNCGKTWAEGELVEAKHLSERVDPGGPMPSGECPECGALCYEESAS